MSRNERVKRKEGKGRMEIREGGGPEGRTDKEGRGRRRRERE